MAQDTPVQLLDKVKSEIAAYESRKPAQLKSELDSFIKKREALVNDYSAQHDALFAQWKAQDDQILRHRAALKCRYPGDGWKAVLKAAIATACSGMNDLADDIAARDDAAHGPNEKARDDAKAAALAAESELQDLQKNAAQCKAWLAEHQKKLVALGQEIAAPQGSRALGLLWLDLLPEHVRLAPETADIAYAQGEAPWDLGPWYPKASDGDLPQLIDPKVFGARLDAAWIALDTARMTYGQAEGVFAAEPDDLATERAMLASQVSQRGPSVLSALQAVEPPAPSSGPASPAGPSGSPATPGPAPTGGSAPSGEPGQPRRSPADAATRQSGTGAGTAAPAGTGTPDGPPVHP